MQSYVLHTVSVFLSLFFCIIIPFLSAPVHAADSLPSQQSRFEGMGSTFKAKKQQSSDSSSAGKDLNTADEENAQNDQPQMENSYFKLHTFVVNIIDKRADDKLFFLTLEVYCEIRDVNERDLIDEHIAPIKDTIITHVSGLKRSQIQTQKQKKELQTYLSEKSKAVIKQLTGKAIINDLYITRILIQ